ncbi:MAG: DNA repair protein RadC [Candidatus Latescibacterota bacterium]
MPPDPPKTEGHRVRLRERFLKSGVEGFHDYEIVELLLTLGTPRRDCKQQAKDAIGRFKTLRGVFEASAEELQEIEGIGPHSAFGIRLVKEVAQKLLKERMLEQPVYTSSKEVFDYLYHTMRGLKKETFKVLFLNAKNRVIAEKNLFEGTLNVSSVYPREVVKSALEHHAASLIFVHNHPSGNPDPSPSDREITEELVFAGCIMQIKVLDHIIIGDNRYFSFADEGMIEEYAGRFLRRKPA